MKEINVTCDSCGAKDNQHDLVREVDSKTIKITRLHVSVEFEDNDNGLRALDKRSLYIDVDLCDECFDKRWEELKKFGR